MRAIRFFVKGMEMTASWAGQTVLVALFVLILVDVLGRLFLNRPLRGGYEMVETLLAVVVFFGFVCNEIEKKHIATDWGKRLGATFGRVLEVVWVAAWAFLFGIVSVGMFNSAAAAFQNNEYLGDARWPTGPIIALEGALSTALVLVLLIRLGDAIHSLASHSGFRK